MKRTIARLGGKRHWHGEDPARRAEPEEHPAALRRGRQLSSATCSMPHDQQRRGVARQRRCRWRSPPGCARRAAPNVARWKGQAGSSPGFRSRSGPHMEVAGPITRACSVCLQRRLANSGRDSERRLAGAGQYHSPEAASVGDAATRSRSIRFTFDGPIVLPIVGSTQTIFGGSRSDATGHRTEQPDGGHGPPQPSASSGGLCHPGRGAALRSGEPSRGCPAVGAGERPLPALARNRYAATRADALESSIAIVSRASAGRRSACTHCVTT